MEEYEELQGFDQEKLNDRIKEEDEIQYKKIRVSKTRLVEGIQHIRERHLDKIARFFASLKIPNWKSSDPVESYRLDLELPENFCQYHRDLTDITGAISKLERRVYGNKRDIFRQHFYLCEPEKAVRCSREQDPESIKDFENNIIQNNGKLQNARSLLSADDLDTIDCTIIDLLDHAVRNPTEIWREGDVHEYISPFFDKSKKIQPEDSFICFVVMNDGKLFTAYFKKPELKEIPGWRHQIYPYEGLKCQNV